MMSIEPLGPALGARIVGYDLSAPISPAVARTITGLLAEHLVLVFPDQDLTHRRHVELAELFGTPYVHPFLQAVDNHPAVLEVIKEPDDSLPFGGEYWHADITFRNPPAAVSLLYADDVPTIGGDTLFANQHLAFEALSIGLQKVLGSLDAIHVYPDRDEGDDDASAVHPVVRVHPMTGRPALYVNPAFVTRFDAMTADESRPLLDYLYQVQVRPEFCHRLSWENRQLVLWDNRAVLHYAVNDYPGRRRVLYRVTSMEVDTAGAEAAGKSEPE